MLNFAFSHNYDTVAQGKSLFLVVGDVDESDAEFLMHLFEFELHIFSHLEVECGERFVKKKHFGFVDNSPGYRHALLLSAGEGVHIAELVVGHRHHLECTLDAAFYFAFLYPFEFQSESHVLINVQMGE